MSRVSIKYILRKTCYLLNENLLILPHKAKKNLRKFLKFYQKILAYQALKFLIILYNNLSIYTVNSFKENRVNEAIYVTSKFICVHALFNY